MRHNLCLVLSYSVCWSHWTRKKNAIYGDEIFGMLICIINFSVWEMNFRIFFSPNHHQMFPTESREQKNILSIDFIMTKHIDMLYTVVATICRKIEVCYLKRWFFTDKMWFKTPYLNSRHVTQYDNTSPVNRTICKSQSTKKSEKPLPRGFFSGPAKKYYQNVESQIFLEKFFFAFLKT